MKRIASQHMRRSLLSPRSVRLLSPTSSINPSRRCFALSTRLAQDAPVIPSPSATLSDPVVDTPSADSDLSSTDLGRTLQRAARRSSPKLVALHARLSLPPRFPVQSLARCLVHPSAEPNPQKNNAPLAVIGQDLLAYYTAEWLLCNYPRLPMQVLFAAQYAYSGPRTLSAMRNEWGVESVATPGLEVDPGLLQFNRQKPGNAMAEGAMVRLKDMPANHSTSASARSNSLFNYRRGVSSRIVYDNQFGDLQDSPDSPTTSSQSPDGTVTTEEASASFINAVFGALYLHAGAQATQAFHQAHILSRHIPLHTLFSFTHPTRDLSRLCARENFEPPVARLLSETGRHSRSPVFVVGVYSGSDKLGEAAGSSLDEARVRATAAALRSWYLYSPPRENIVLPSQSATTQWKPQMIDIGEIVT
ncbi:ribonuclease III [Aureobasidium sp. EXF-10727]|nr:ribonuclease III [Aureobasidium sp. EXF-10727]